MIACPICGFEETIHWWYDHQVYEWREAEGWFKLHFIRDGDPEWRPLTDEKKLEELRKIEITHKWKEEPQPCHGITA